MRANGLGLDWCYKKSGAFERNRTRAKASMQKYPPPSTPHSKGTAYAQALVSISRHTQILELLEKQGQTHGGYSKYLRGSG